MVIIDREINKKGHDLKTIAIAKGKVLVMISRQYLFGLDGGPIALSLNDMDFQKKFSALHNSLKKAVDNQIIAIFSI